ncbi:RAD55 family ATPase [Dongia soli]|uniref:non-specific serine/threonine protein kinase n=1 Tax=Dongia soli TaxID=600628 RepID=A0ABU5EDR6_9PROT|nr:ATPase domain-containing protein [Dongia soli]MDY0884489.1 ATPase domain-containing protein [Dongia soli]
MVIEKFNTGVPGLDRILAGGFQRGSAYILQGPPGAGKTVLANQFCFSHARGGGRALYMSLLAESHDRMLAYMSEMAFYDSSFLPENLQYVSGFGVLEREGLPGLLKLMQHEIKRHRATAVVLDGIFVAHSDVTEGEYRKFVHELQGVANYLNAVLVMLTHQNRNSGSPEHTMVDGWIELSDELKDFRSYRTIQVKKHRGSGILPGKHHFRIDDQGISVFPRVEVIPTRELTRRLPSVRISTGIGDLDKMLCGGLTKASATVVFGPTGTGKTTLALHFLAEATPQEPAIMLGLYETPAGLLNKAGSIGLDLDAAIASGAVELVWRPSAENLVDELVLDLLAKVEARGAKRVVVDGIVALRDNLVARGRFAYILSAMNARLSELGATVVYTSEIRDMHAPSMLPSDDISMFVENVIVLTYLRQEDALRRSLSVLKLRDSDFDPRAREFYIGDSGIIFGMDPQLRQNGA